MTGVDVIDNLIDITNGATPIVSPSFSNEEAIINYVYAEPGVFSSLDGIDELMKDNLISAVYQYKSFGSEIKSSNYSSDRPVGFLIKASDKESLRSKISEINKRIKVLDEDGHDIMRHDIFEGVI